MNIRIAKSRVVEFGLEIGASDQNLAKLNLSNILKAVHGKTQEPFSTPSMLFKILSSTIVRKTNHKRIDQAIFISSLTKKDSIVFTKKKGLLFFPTKPSDKHISMLSLDSG